MEAMGSDVVWTVLFVAALYGAKILDRNTERRFEVAVRVRLGGRRLDRSLEILIEEK